MLQRCSAGEGAGCRAILSSCEQAIALATENVTSGRGGPFGAVVVRGGEIIATGVNLRDCD